MKKALWLWIVIDANDSCSKPVWISLFC